jgi:hypothetical protein
VAWPFNEGEMKRSLWYIDLRTRSVAQAPDAATMVGNGIGGGLAMGGGRQGRLSHPKIPNFKM